MQTIPPKRMLDTAVIQDGEELILPVDIFSVQALSNSVGTKGKKLNAEAYDYLAKRIDRNCVRIDGMFFH